MKKAIYSKESAQLREWLVNKRNEAGLNQRKFAEQLNLHQSIVAKIETGERQLNVIELIDYCRVLDADPVEIINKLKLSKNESML